MDQLINTTRAADVDIVAPDSTYLFGMDNGSSDTYTCKFLGSTDDDRETVLLMTHIGYQQWVMPLRFYRKPDEE
jgi:hypothetical protein